VKVCYALASYISHWRAGLAYRACLRDAGIEVTSDPADADLWIWHAEPWAIPGYHRAFRNYPRRPIVAYCVWETDVLPDAYPAALAGVDRIWTPSEFSARAFAPLGKPVDVIPHVVDPLVAAPDVMEAMRRRIGWREGCCHFYAIGPHTMARKGVADTIAAFAGLFDETEARLIVKSPTPLPPELAGIPGVVDLHGHLEDEEIAALHLVGDCLVSLHHAEGFGLHLAEAMAVGRIVIATAHGGNVEFMTDENSLLVPCTVENLREADLVGSSRFTARMRWGYADRDAARELMRRVVRERARVAGLGKRAALDLNRFSTRALSASVAELACAAASVGDGWAR
jgi:glycosyltransferase involved in cell wall biosynthesis